MNELRNINYQVPSDYMLSKAMNLRGTGRLSGIDGLRVIALVAVSAYHLLPDKFVGAYLAVDFFFIAAAFLSTQSMLQKWQKLDLLTTYKKRLQRLFPDLFIVCTVFLVAAFLFTPKLMQNMLPNYLASSFFLNNIWQILLGDSYFADAIAPSPYKHLWYIAVLAQLSILWPLIFKFFAGFTQKRSRLRRKLLFVSGALVVVSLILMFVLYQPNQDPTRVYYGTETRAYAYFCGAFLALLFPTDRLQFIAYYNKSKSTNGRMRRNSNSYNQNVHFFDLAVVPLLVTIFVLYMLLEPKMALVYRGGFAVNACLQAALLLCIVIPETFFSKLFDLPVFRFLGARSYVYYLWQYPIMIFIRETLSSFGLKRWMSVCLNIVLTLLLSELAYRYRSAFKLHSLVKEFKLGEIKLQSVAKIFVALVFLCAIVPALMNSKVVDLRANEAYQEQIRQAAKNAADLMVEESSTELESSPSESYQLPKREAETATVETSRNVLEVNTGGNVTKGPYDLATMLKFTQSALSDEELAALENIKVSAVGDSVLLGVSKEIGNIFPLFRYKAKESAQVDAGISYLQQFKDKNALGDVVLVAVGQNGYMSESQARKIMQLAGDRPVFAFTIFVGKEWESANNKIWYDLVGEYPNLEIVDWHTFAANNKELLWDGIHPDNKGQAAYAKLFARTLLRKIGKSDV